MNALNHCLTVNPIVAENALMQEIQTTQRSCRSMPKAVRCQKQSDAKSSPIAKNSRLPGTANPSLGFRLRIHPSPPSARQKSQQSTTIPTINQHSVGRHISAKKISIDKGPFLAFCWESSSSVDIAASFGKVIAQGLRQASCRRSSSSRSANRIALRKANS